MSRGTGDGWLTALTSSNARIHPPEGATVDFNTALNTVIADLMAAPVTA